MVGATPDLRLPSQPQSVTALWPVPNYSAWWQRHMGVKLWTTCPELFLGSGLWPGVELASFWLRANALTTEPPSHPAYSAWSIFDGSLYGVCGDIFVVFVRGNYRDVWCVLQRKRLAKCRWEHCAVVMRYICFTALWLDFTYVTPSRIFATDHFFPSSSVLYCHTLSHLPPAVRKNADL